MLINAGSHGSKRGKNSHSTGNFEQTESRIVEEIENLIAELIENHELKLNLNNIADKIYIHTLSSSIPCVYTLWADHIIDVQCMGAYDKISAENLVPQGTSN